MIRLMMLKVLPNFVLILVNCELILRGTGILQDSIIHRSLLYKNMLVTIVPCCVLLLTVVPRCVLLSMLVVTEIQITLC